METVTCMFLLQHCLPCERMRSVNVYPVIQIHSVTVEGSHTSAFSVTVKKKKNKDNQFNDVK